MSEHRQPVSSVARRALAAGERPELPIVDNLLRFIAALRRSGVSVSVQQSIDLAQALPWVDFEDRRRLFYVSRSLLVSRKEDLGLFEALFDRFFRPESNSSPPRKAPTAPRHDPPKAERFNVVTYMAYKARRFDQEVDVADKSMSYSSTDLLRNKDFSEMSKEELDRVRRVIQGMSWRASLRRTRRRVSGRRGDQLDLRRAVRQTLRFGCVPDRLPRLDRKLKERPIVLVADISGSMEKYSRLVLLFFYSLCHVFKNVEAFVFGTRLSYLSPELRLRNVDQALGEASRQVTDWSGGTRIGESLGELNRRWSRRVLRRGAVVLVVSDGWERGDTDRLSREMRYLSHRCHRLIWLNPLSGRAGYQPLVEGMQAALPWVDDFLPIHNLQSIEELAEHLQRLPSRSRGTGHVQTPFGRSHIVPAFLNGDRS